MGTRPCIIGVAQRTWHLAGAEQAPEPLAMLTELVRAAATDSGARGDVLAAVDDLRVVYCMSWPYDDPAGRLAEALGLGSGRREYSGMSGTVPQQLVSAAATDIVAGRTEVAVVAGAEALDTVRRLKKAGERPAWSHRHPEKQQFPFEAPFHPAEIAHEVFQAWLTFALRDVARRARLGMAPEAYRTAIAGMLAPMTEVAAANPYAWFPVARTAADLAEVRPDNRIVGYPYTKLEVAIMDVDMAASVIVASDEAADRLGVPAEQRVYLRGTAYATDPVYVAEHPDLSRSPAMAAVLESALAQAGVAIDEVAHLDLYSCFAASLNFAADALGLDVGAGSRPLTVTGGLPYCGGPASNYMGHALATMVGVLRADPGSVGLVSGVGMHMTKHIAAAYSTDPGAGWSGSDREASEPAAPSALLTGPPIALPIADTYQGPATVASYSVVHGRDGAAEWGLVVADVADGRTYGRTYGRVEDVETLAAMEAEEFVGRTVHLTPDGPVNRVTASIT